jgi:hypothetical protein
MLTGSTKISMTRAVQAVMWIQKLISTIEGLDMTCTLFADNTAAKRVAANPEASGMTKHFSLRHFFIREVIDDRIIWLVYFPTAQMIADSLTKTKRMTQELISTLFGLKKKTIQKVYLQRFRQRTKK